MKFEIKINENSYLDQLLAFYQKSSDDQTSDQTHKLSYENMLLMNAIEELNKNDWNPKVITASTENRDSQEFEWNLKSK